jgi:hypothetical protein
MADSLADFASGGGGGVVLRLGLGEVARGTDGRPEDVQQRRASGASLECREHCY